MTTVLARPTFHSSSTSSSHTWLRGSRALVGSSISRTCGSIVSTLAIATRFFSPPDSVYGGAVEQLRRCAAARRLRRRGRGPRPRRARAGAGRRRVRRRRCRRRAARRRPGRRSRRCERNSRRNAGSSSASSVSAWPNAVMRTGRGEDEPVEHLEQRRLAAAVRADDGDVLAGLDRQVDAVEREHPGAVLVADARRGRTRAVIAASPPGRRREVRRRRRRWRRATPSRARWREAARAKASRPRTRARASRRRRRRRS